ncbi:MAG: MFS transporter [Smithellaceae bacterium]|nr:MFS transporter [Smithellaceae bacterium]
MNNEKKIVLFTSVAHFYTHFFELIFPALAIPLTLSLNMSLAEVLPISFLMYLLFGLGALPWGIIADRFGNKRSLVIFFVGAGLGSILTSFSTTSTALFFALAIIGFFSSIYHPAGLGLLSRGVRDRGRAMGINGAAGSAGIAMAPLMAGFFNWIIGWRMIYLLAGIISLLLGFLMAITRIDETPIHTQDVSTEAAKSRVHLKTLLALSFVLIMSGIAYRMNTVILPAYLEFKAPFLWNWFLGLNVTQMASTATLAATILATFIYVVGIFGQYFGGWISDKYKLSHVYVVFVLLGLPFLLAMAFLTDLALVLASSFYIFFALGMQPVENSLVAKLTPSQFRSTGYGIKFLLTFGVGALAVYIAGWIKGMWNLEMVYVFSASVIALMALGIFYLIRHTRNQETGTP